MRYRLFPSFILIIVLTVGAFAQTTEFTFQGSLKDNAAPANGNYDFEFALFDLLSAGSQVGAAIPKNNVAVTNGAFSVALDFGPVFPGAGRFLEVRVRLSGQPGFTTLTPRQAVNSAPYSVKSLATDNAQQLGGIEANQYVQTNDARLSDARAPLPGSNDYVQNTNSAQAGVNFNVGGTGTANILNAATQFNLGGNRVLGNPGANNLFVGIGAGAVNSGSDNSFVGTGAGSQNTTGFGNVLIGNNSGLANLSGNNNTAIGNKANFSFTSGSFSTAIGAYARTFSEDQIVLGKTAGVYDGVPRIADKVLVPGSLDVLGSSTIVGNNSGVASGGYLAFDDCCGTQLGYVGDGSSTTNDMYLTSYSNNVHLFTQTGAALTARPSGSLIMRGGAMEPGTNYVAQTFDLGANPFRGIWTKSVFMDASGTGAFDLILASPIHVSARNQGLGGGFGGYVLVRCTEPFAPAGQNPISIDAFKEQQAQIEAQQKQIEALTLALCSLKPDLDVCKQK